MAEVYVSRLKVAVPSKSRQGYVHPAKTEIAPIKRVGKKWLVEIRTLEGGDRCFKNYWYEHLLIDVDQSEVVEIEESERLSTLPEPKDLKEHLMLLVFLVDEAATMMGDAVGSYGCTHIDDLTAWLDKARRYFPNQDGIENVADRLLGDYGNGVKNGP